jgi:hypothetical protein
MVKIWRNDDVNPNTDFELTRNLYGIIKEYSPESRIISCINIFSRKNNVGSLYKEVPFKNQPVTWFYDVDQIVSLDWVNKYRDISDVVSHGLFHINHAKVAKSAQEMSIVGSCKLLKTRVFVPPFNAYNGDTVKICKANGIKLVTPDEWKTIDYSDFNDEHELWYMHSWRWTTETLEKKLCHSLQRV